MRVASDAEAATGFHQFPVAALKGTPNSPAQNAAYPNVQFQTPEVQKESYRANTKVSAGPFLLESLEEKPFLASSRSSGDCQQL